jgi:hypothetical protein
MATGHAIFFRNSDMVVFGPYADKDFADLLKRHSIGMHTEFADSFSGPWCGFAEYVQEHRLGVYFYRFGEEVRGPITCNDIEALSAKGELSLSTPIAHSPLGPWKRFEEFDVLFPVVELEANEDVVSKSKAAAQMKAVPSKETYAWADTAWYLTAVAAVIGAFVGAGRPLELLPFLFTLALNPIAWLAIWFWYLSGAVRCPNCHLRSKMKLYHRYRFNAKVQCVRCHGYFLKNWAYWTDCSVKDRLSTGGAVLQKRSAIAGNPSVVKVAEKHGEARVPTWALPSGMLLFVAGLLSSVLGAGQPLELPSFLLTFVVNPLLWLSLWCFWRARNVNCPSCRFRNYVADMPKGSIIRCRRCKKSFHCWS